MADASTSFSKNFRKLSPTERLAQIQEALGELKSADSSSIVSMLLQYQKLLNSNAQLTAIADSMIESAVGNIAIPLGIVSNLYVDGVPYYVPLATEEASVIAAANYAASIFAKASNTSGPSTQINPPLQIAQIALLDVSTEGESRLIKNISLLHNELLVHLTSMQKRGGGLRRIDFRRLPNGIQASPAITQPLVVHLTIDVQDAMGANIANTAAEFIAPKIAEISGGRVLSAIVSNYHEERLVHANISLDIHKIPTRGLPCQQVAQDIANMSVWAEQDIYRATTHNKGIMNGISALALASYNDTRALEAAAHGLAATSITPTRSSTYSPLSKWTYIPNKQVLEGKITVPALLATKGGSTQHPTAQWARAVLSLNTRKPISAHHLNRVAASLGLAQNFAALLALVTTGIQKGHMKHHNKKFSTLQNPHE